MHEDKMDEYGRALCGWLLGPLGLPERLLAKALRMKMNLLDPEVHLSVSGISREPSLTHAKHSY